MQLSKPENIHHSEPPRNFDTFISRGQQKTNMHKPVILQRQSRHQRRKPSRSNYESTYGIDALHKITCGTFTESALSWVPAATAKMLRWAAVIWSEACSFLIVGFDPFAFCFALAFATFIVAFAIFIGFILGFIGFILGAMASGQARNHAAVARSKKRWRGTTQTQHTQTDEPHQGTLLKGKRTSIRRD